MGDGGFAFPFVFSEDEKMWIVDCGLWIMIVGGFASPLYSVRMKRCGL